MEKMLWAIIKQSKENKAHLNAPKQYKNFVQLMSAYDIATINKLDDTWTGKLKEIRVGDEFKKLHVQYGGFVSSGDDGFDMDFASWVLAQGEELIEAFQTKGHSAIAEYVHEHKVSEDDYLFECMSYAFDDAKRKFKVN